MYPQRNKVMPNDQPKRYKHFIHSPFTFENSGIKVKVDETGKMILTKDAEDGTFDEITTSASLINRVIRLLQIESTFSLDHLGVKVRATNNDITLTQDHPDGTFDEIKATPNFIQNCIRMLQTTRKVVYKPTPFMESEEESQ